MGAFYARRHDLNKSGTPHSVSIINRCFSAQGFCDCQVIENSAWHILVYKKLNVENENIFLLDSDNFIFSVGTFIYRDTFGELSLKSFLHDIRNKSIDWDRVYGHYCIGICVEGNTRFFVDPTGIYKVYLDSTESIISSSFLAVLESLDSRHVNTQAIYEYVFQGATYGNNTVLEEIGLLGPKRCVGGKDEHEPDRPLPRWKLDQ